MNFRSSFNPRSRQRGNTSPASIIGLIIGLTIAVAVALVITKGSTPFHRQIGAAAGRTDCGPGRRSEQADVRQQGCGARSGTRILPRTRQRRRLAIRQAVVDKIQGTPAAAPAPVEKPKAAPPATAAVPAAANVAPAPAKAAPAAAADSGDDKFIYYLQAGAFREMSDAESHPRQAGPARLRGRDLGPRHRQRRAAPRASGPVQPGRNDEQGTRKLSKAASTSPVVRNQK
jgi:hypothetical protein